MEKRLITYRQSRIKHWRMLARFAVPALLAFVTACSTAPEQSSSTPDKPSTVAASLSAEQVLQQMSDKLKGAQQLTFKVTRQLDAALIEEGDLPEKAQVEFAVARPNKLKATSTSSDGVRTFYADGQTVALFDEQMKLYASVASAGTIDETFTRFDEKYGFTPPLAEFTLNDPFKKLSQQIQTSSNKGLETINGVECNHVAGTGEFADAEIWVATSDQLPRRLVVTFKQREGSPQLKADFSEWNLSAKLDDKSFTFTPPEGAEKIEMLTTEQMDEVAQKSEKAEVKQK